MASWTDDDDLMRDLGDAVREGEAVPPRFREAARAAFAWRTVDRELEELLALTHDSALADPVVVRAVPPSTAPRVLSFAGGEVGLEVEIDGAQLMGQVLPPRRCQVVLRPAEGPTVTVDVDDSGFFSAAGVPTGNVKLEVVLGRSRLATAWLLL